MFLVKLPVLVMKFLRWNQKIKIFTVDFLFFAFCSGNKIGTS
jgi:hypothetical protein